METVSLRFLTQPRNYLEYAQDGIPTQCFTGSLMLMAGICVPC